MSRRPTRRTPTPRLPATLTPTQPDAWLRLVLQTMPIQELQAEAENELNSDAERAAMRAELQTRRTR